jgi:aminocarboxymuconate-semialdehyde decarboxylase
MALPRLDQGWRTMQQWLPRPPSQYVANFYFDTLLYDAPSIGLLIAKFGAQRVMVGSDYPFVVRETPPGLHLREVGELSAAQREHIHTRSALEFLGVSGA